MRLEEEEKVSLSEEESKPCYLFYRPKNSTLSPHLHAGLVGSWQKLKEDVEGALFAALNTSTGLSLPNSCN